MLNTRDKEEFRTIALNMNNGVAKRDWDIVERALQRLVEAVVRQLDS